MNRSLLLRLVSLLLVLLACAIAYQKTNSMDENSQLVWRVPIFVIGGAVLSLMAVAFFLPAIGDRIGQFFYSSPEKVEPDPCSKARALVAQGDYAGAIEAYLEVARQTPGDRLPVVEAMRLAREKLHDTKQAISIVEDAVNDHDWQEEDAAYFLFRLVEMHEEDLQDRAAAATFLRHVIAYFPETRHSANATHKLREWGMEPGPI